MQRRQPLAIVAREVAPLCGGVNFIVNVGAEQREPLAATAQALCIDAAGERDGGEGKGNGGA